jgi:hypothetical protein
MCRLARSRLSAAKPHNYEHLDDGAGLKSPLQRFIEILPARSSYIPDSSRQRHPDRRYNYLDHTRRVVTSARGWTGCGITFATSSRPSASVILRDCFSRHRHSGRTIHHTNQNRA